MSSYSLNGLWNSTFLRKLIRIPLKLIPHKCVIKVLSGYNRGYYWIKGSGVNGYWLGNYEWEKQEHIRKLARKNMIVYDIGAHVGFYTLMLSKLVQNRGFVYAFEPNLRNLIYLQRHVKMNRLKNVTIIPAAVGNFSGYTHFHFSESSSMGFISNDMKDKTVSIIRIDDYVQQKKIKPPHLLKIDIEGSEEDMLKGASNTIENFKPIILLALHKDDSRIRIIKFLSSLNYKISCINDDPNEIVAVWNSC